MMIPYVFRLVCLSLACFFLVHLAVGLTICVAAPAAIRISERLSARRAARVLFSLRLAPLAFGVLAVAGFCVPSYLKLEPESAAEPIGVVCLAAALLSAAICGVAIWRGSRAIVRSLLYMRQCEREGSTTPIAGQQVPVWVIEGTAPVVALAGILRPRLVISRPVLMALSMDQLAAVLRHERAHRTSRDNLKRLAIVLAPDVVPFTRGFRAIERGWARFTEWAADDRAVAGDPRISLSLAAALVRVARMSAGTQSSCLVSPLLAGSDDLEARIDRLLSPSPESAKPERGLLVTVTTFLLAGSLTAVIMQPGILASVHGMLEHLVH